MKPTEADRDRAFDRFVARGLEQETDASGHACPDADLLAAWFDHSLSEAESKRVESHASSCACCQQILADLSRSEPAVLRAVPAPEPSRSRPWHWHWRWLVPVATAAVVIVVGGRTLWAPVSVTLPSAPKAALDEKPATVAELQPQATPARSPAAPAPAGRAAGVAPAVPAQRQQLSAPAKAELRKEDVEAPRPAAPAAPPPPPAAAESQLQAPPPPAAGAAADRVNAGVARTEAVLVTAEAPITQAPSGDRRPAAKALTFSRDSAEPVFSVSAAGPGGATATWRFGQRGAVERSVDDGRTWERQQSGVTTLLRSGSAPSPGVCWLVGERGVVIRTVDGRSWQRCQSPTAADLVSVRASGDSNARVTASDGAEFETADGGRTWTNPVAARGRRR